jgi:hypothetical protein
MFPPGLCRRDRCDGSADRALADGHGALARDGFDILTPTGSLQTQAAHRALDCAAGNGHLISFQLAPSFLGAVDLHVFLANSLNLGHQSFIALSALTAQ